ncbi:RNA-directed DNA polymerase (Reverse transcriptase), Ribonuclease H [Gossypium australe]|uniref:RNA-directed DNA polymerase (Reverse transcriptase), Ribonuclease H n=1 Tax=Gossypium australe TaxID=47621 RepID=A0A5B6UZK4_9ROSI|nr:RNA-directed DNA polymerase (Reverse transcriptase), Ribonuclease H [Gossypium australe]
MFIPENSNDENLIFLLQKDFREKRMPNWKKPYVEKNVFSGRALILTKMGAKDLPNPVNSGSFKNGRYKLYVPKGTVEGTLKLQRGKLAEQKIIVSFGFLSKVPAEQESMVTHQ